jgi:magnesium transporter
MLSEKVEASLNDPVTRHLRGYCSHIRLGQTVGEALEAVRCNPPTDAILYFYVVDDDDRLQGVVPTRQLLLNPPERLIAEIMVRKVVALPDHATVREACEFFAIHRFLALPVVDAQRRLLGVLDVHLYTEELGLISDAEQRDNLFQALGVHAGQRGESSPTGAFLRRFPWLICNLAGGIFCALLASLFEAQLQRVVALAMFIPVVLNLAESVSSQSVSLTLHLLRGQRPSWRMAAQGLRQELATGLMLGAACGAAVGAMALAWLGHWPLMWCLLAGVGGGVAASALLGMAMPIVLKALHLDPRVAAGPIALAAADVATLGLYLGMARWLL